MKCSLQLKHAVGFLLFSIIFSLTIFIDIVDKIPAIASKLPMRYMVTAKQEVKLYDCKFQEKNVIGVLQTGETAEFQAWACPWRVLELSDGSKACLYDEDKVEQKLHKFYYF